MKRKNQSAARLPGDWTEQQYQPSKAPHALWLPEPQEKCIQTPGPGKREDGKLWFEGDRKEREEYNEESEL